MGEVLIIKNKYMGLYENKELDMFILRPLGSAELVDQKMFVRSDNLFIPYSWLTKHYWDFADEKIFKSYMEEYDAWLKANTD